MKRIFLLLILLFLISCTLQQGPTVTFQTPRGNVPVRVETAETLEQWAKGLMGRESLPENHGMLFLFPDERDTKMWMKDTKIPLDILFFNKDFEIVDLKENFQPCTENCERDLYTAKQKTQYVLEVNAGFVQKNTIAIGQKATFTRA